MLVHSKCLERRAQILLCRRHSSQAFAKEPGVPPGDTDHTTEFKAASCRIGRKAALLYLPLNPNDDSPSKISVHNANKQVGKERKKRTAARQADRAVAFRRWTRLKSITEASVRFLQDIDPPAEAAKRGGWERWLEVSANNGGIVKLSDNSWMNRVRGGGRALLAVILDVVVKLLAPARGVVSGGAGKGYRSGQGIVMCGSIVLASVFDRRAALHAWSALRVTRGLSIRW